MTERPLPTLSILVVEDDVTHGELIREVLEAEGHTVVLAPSGAEGLRHLERPGIDLMVTDLRLNDRDGLDLVRRCQELRGDGPVPQSIVVTGFGSVEGAVLAMRAGAIHYLQKPLDVGMLRETVRAAAGRVALERQNRELHAAIDKSFAFPGILGETPGMQHVFDVMNQVMDTDATVLIRGESGTGKELVAQALHRSGPRRSGPFIPVNCAALAEGLLESELFGHERGAFTGAHMRRKGRFEAAHRGTLFLDEIGDMPPATQATLLRTLESGEVVRVGSNEPIKVNVRLIAATNRDLEAMVSDGKFREDLSFRLRVVVIYLPPLRERLADLPRLASHFLTEAAQRHNRPAKTLAPETLDVLLRYRWPGNVRELKNALESMVLLSRSPVLTPETVPPYVRPEGQGPGALATLTSLPLPEVERALILNTLRDVGGNRERASLLLGLSTRTLYRKIREYGLARATDKADSADEQ